MSLIINQTKDLSSMRTVVYFLVREDETVFSEDDVDNAINIGLHAVYDITNTEPVVMWRSTEAGTREYSLPEARMVDGRAVVDRVILEESDGTVTELSPTMWDYDDDDTESDTPSSYYVTGTYIGLEPTPDDAYTLTVHYRKDFTPLTADDDEPNLNDIDIDAALFYAAFILKTIDEEFDSAAAFKSQFEEIVGRSTTIKPGVYSDGSSFGEYGGAA